MSVVVVKASKCEDLHWTLVAEVARQTLAVENCAFQVRLLLAVVVVVGLALEPTSLWPVITVKLHCC